LCHSDLTDCQCTLAQDTISHIAAVEKGKTITYRGADYSVQLYKKLKRSDVSERAIYVDKDYYRFQYSDKCVTKLLRMDEVIATRKDDSFL
jgi:hypothetical protein